jgi:hypothetical protein
MTTAMVWRICLYDGQNQRYVMMVKLDRRWSNMPICWMCVWNIRKQESSELVD